MGTRKHRDFSGQVKVFRRFPRGAPGERFKNAAATSVAAVRREANRTPHAPPGAAVRQGRTIRPMSKRLVLENEFAYLWFHPEAGIVHHQFRKFIWGEAYQYVLNEGLDLLVREGASKWLSENRQDTVHSRADTDWALQKWQPRAVKAGWKHWAIVPPENVIGQMNMERLAAASVPYGVQARVFTAATQALAWLEAADRAF
jgi:hypothetical protein